MAQAVQWADRARAPTCGRHARRRQRARRRPSCDALLQGSEVVGRQTVAAGGRAGLGHLRPDGHPRDRHAHRAPSSSLQKPKAAVSLLKALRGYALLLWVLVNFLAGKSNLGPQPDQPDRGRRRHPRRAWRSSFPASPSRCR